MATGKKYYWLKLKTDFMTSDKVDYLMSQQNGAEYVVLYQMLCLKCINTDGVLARQIGEIIIPFDAEKIQRDCKYFNIDTIKQAFSLFIQLGMIYQEENGFLRIAEFENLVGSETDFAAQKRNQRNKELPAISGQCIDNGVDNVHIESESDTDKEKDIYDNDNDCDKVARISSFSPKPFEIPTPTQVYNFYLEMKLKIKPYDFYNLNQKNGWSDERGRIENWCGAYIEMNRRQPDEWLKHNPDLKFNKAEYRGNK